MHAAAVFFVRAYADALDILERWSRLLLLLVIALLAPTWVTQITADRLTGDEVANARMAVNLAHHGVISHDNGPSPLETMYREPVPPVTAAAFVWLADAKLGEAPTDAYLSGERAQYLKYHHVFWKALAVAGTHALIVALGAPPVAGLAGALLVGTRRDIDSLTTELEAGALLVVASAALVAGLRRRRVAPLVLAGVLFGLTALTKAAALYVFAGLLAALAAVLWLMPTDDGHRETPRRIFVAVAALTVGFAVVTLPWMHRNYVKLDSFQISSRAGIVLFLRATKNQMSWDEFKGAFYVWSRPELKPLLGALTGYDEADLPVGGKLQRLNRKADGEFARIDLEAELAGEPEKALTFYRRARAERVRLVAEYSARLEPRAAELEADRELARRALDAIVDEPFRHLAMSLPLTWRGAHVYLPVLLLLLGYAYKTRRRELLLVALLCAGFIAFHSLFSHFEPRYSVPLKGTIGALLIAAFVDAWRLLRTRIEVGRLTSRLAS